MSVRAGRDPGSQPAGGVVMNLTVSCRYFLSGPRLPSQPQSIIALWPVQIILLGDKGTCVYEELAQSHYPAAKRPGVEPAIS